MIKLSKQLDLGASLYELTNLFPELIPILKDLGFIAITNPMIRNTIGRKMTIPNGCEKQNIPLERVVKQLEARGFEVLQ